MTYHDLKLIRIKKSVFSLQVELIINLNKSSATVDAVFFPVKVPRSALTSSTNIIGNKILQEYNILLMPRRVLSVSSL